MNNVGIRKKSVLLAFSGGIDSSYCVGKLRGEGYDVHGLILDMTCDGDFIRQASEKARSLELEYTVLDIRSDFEDKIIGYFTSEYLSGRTPAPCTICNPQIKWKYLYDIALKKGFDRIATGHYFRIAEREGRYYVKKALDPVKDQSYYLWMLPHNILEMALTPMGDEIKKEVTAVSPFSQKESMGVCFLKGRDYREFIRDRHSDHPSCLPGNITDAQGKSIGRHDGCAFYTIGQKKGMGLPEGYSVTGIDPRTNTLIAGPKENLEASTIILEKYILMPDHKDIEGELRLIVRGYGVNPEGGCTIAENGRRLVVELDNPAWAPAPGQPSVLYKGDIVVGGGFIAEYY